MPYGELPSAFANIRRNRHVGQAGSEALHGTGTAKTLRMEVGELIPISQWNVRTPKGTLFGRSRFASEVH